MLSRLGPFVLVALVASGCGSRGADTTQLKVHNGQAVTGTTDPVLQSTVALLENGKAFCTGTLIASDVVVSAAHCFEGFRARPPRGDVEVGFGSGPTYQTKIAVAEARYHRGFSLPDQRSLQRDWSREYPEDFAEFAGMRRRETAGQTLTPTETTRMRDLTVQIVGYVRDRMEHPRDPVNDVAIVKLASASPAWTRPVAIAADGVIGAGSEVIGAGYGITFDEGRSGVLYKTPLFVETLEAAAREIRISSEGDGELCPGDSGGPLFKRDGDGQLTLLGAASRVKTHGRCGELGAFSTDLRGHRAWLACQQASFRGAPADPTCDAQAVVTLDF